MPWSPTRSARGSGPGRRSRSPASKFADKPGTPAYFELITHGYERAVQFYTDAFGWQGRVASDTTDFRMTVLDDGEQTVAGIMDAEGIMDASQGDHWGVYFKVADTDAALDTVTRLGGTVTTPAMDTPYAAWPASPTARHPLQAGRLTTVPVSVTASRCGLRQRRDGGPEVTGRRSG